MFSTDTEGMQQIQSDVLLESLSTNPYFKKSTIANKNKALTTNSEFIVGAINEILKKHNTSIVTTDTALNQVYDIVGNVNSNPELLVKLKEIGDNLILAIIALNDKINQLQSNVSVKKSYCQVINIDEGTQNVFKLTYIPCSIMKFYVNGILYSLNKEYTYDEEANTITWIFDKISELGFSISAPSVVSIIYDYLPLEQCITEIQEMSD